MANGAFRVLCPCQAPVVASYQMSNELLRNPRLWYREEAASVPNPIFSRCAPRHARRSILR